MDLRQSMHDVLRDAGLSKMTRSTYDTAWIARLGDLDITLSQQALNWLCENQLPDGSWGATAPLYYHDRIICTLAAMVALTRHGRRTQDRRQIQRGQHALEMLSRGAPRGLMSDPAGPTIAFEYIMPTLLKEVESHGIISHQHDTVLDRLTRQRAAKLARLPEGMINKDVTLVFSAEMVGIDGLHLLDKNNLQEFDGSLGHSPAATCFFALHAAPEAHALESSLAFLREIAINGAGETIYGIDGFQHAWILSNLALTDCLDDETLALCQPGLNALERHWNSRNGLATILGNAFPDGDTSGVAYEVLSRFGRKVDLQGLLHYEENEHFRCFGLEADPSLSTNVHILGALRQAGFEVQHPSVQKIVRFLKQSQTRHSYWFDKWHASPYYTTCHAIIAGAGYADELVTSAVDWVLNTQNEDGSWGFYNNVSSAEETAYCLQALCVWKRQGIGDEEIHSDILTRGANWLKEHMDDPYPWLWIGKSLYCPELVVESAILSALMLVEQL